jgi:hypothetical protein
MARKRFGFGAYALRMRALVVGVVKKVEKNAKNRAKTCAIRSKSVAFDAFSCGETPRNPGVYCGIL